MSEELYMWSYWKEKRGTSEAVELDYPILLESSIELQQALAMVKNGERAIDSIMSELESKCEDKRWADSA